MSWPVQTRGLEACCMLHMMSICVGRLFSALHFGGWMGFADTAVNHHKKAHSRHI